MDINATLFVQMLTFALFVWFTMKFVWPPITKALEERRDTIAEGLSAAERGKRELELAQHRVVDELREAKQNAAEIIDRANRRAGNIIDEAKNQARIEGQRQAKLAQEQIQRDMNQVKEGLRQQLAGLAVAGAEKILEKEVDSSTHSSLLDKLVEEI